jgi:CHC2 zinc finger
MRNEIDQYLEHNPEVLQAFSDTFIARLDTYPLQLPDGSYSRAHKNNSDNTKTYYPFAGHLLDQHLKGVRTLGAYILDEKSVTTKIVFDDDSEHGLDRLHQLAHTLEAQSVPSYLERSRRGGHLWFFTPPLSGRDARRLGKHLLSEQGLTTKDIELYPKQEYVRKDMVGSLVRLPFGRHQITGEFYGFINRNGEPLAPRRREQIEILAYPDRVSHEFIDSILAVARPAKRTFEIDRTRLKSYSLDMPPDERIKRAVSPIDFISQYVELDGQDRGLCPFHDDHKQSFKVYEDGWHCFAGCEGNTIIDFYIKWKGYQSLTLPPDEWKKVLADMLKVVGF